MNKWIAEVRGISFANKGAQLMAYAIKDQLETMVSSDKKVIVALPLNRYYYHPLFKQDGFYRLLETHQSLQRTHFNFFLTVAGKIIPQSLQNKLQLVSFKAVQVVLDASGFSYSDQWKQNTIHNIEQLKYKVTQCKQQGKKIILLPQAFGPFTEKATRNHLKIIFPQIDWIFARDKISYDYLSELGMEMSNVSLAPDFTNLLKGQLPSYFEVSKHQICIIPNYRMIDRLTPEQGKKYKEFLVTLLNILFERNCHPFLLLHETKSDSYLIDFLINQSGKSIPIVAESDPRYIKGILGHCQVVISSRFHGLISALSQGVPTIATGWSHKYKMLLEDYSCPELLIEDLESPAAIKQALSLVLEEPNRSHLIARLNERANQYRQASEAMWNQVKKICNIN